MENQVLQLVPVSLQSNPRINNTSTYSIQLVKRYLASRYFNAEQEEKNK